MYSKEKLEEIAKRRKTWEAGTLAKTLERFKLKESPQKYYTPLDLKDHDFLAKVGFPGEYPYTGGVYAITSPARRGRGGDGGETRRAGSYSGYGTPEDTRDFYRAMQDRGWTGGPNLAMDLPTQCGLDSDDPRARGEVGKVGVAIDSLRDFEVIYEAFKNGRDLDKIGSNFTINAPANIIIAMYVALAQKRGISPAKLVATPQNDILKEIVARGTYIFPVKQSMRMVRDSIVYCTENTPELNFISISGYHMREAGASPAQSVAFTFANGIAYLEEGIKAGVPVDKFYPGVTFLALGGGIEVMKEIAKARAARRIWAKVMRDRFKAKNPRNWFMRPGGGVMLGNYNTTVQRPLNNLVRAVVAGFASAMASGNPGAFPPYDEPLGLGWSLEAQQLSADASRVMSDEARLTEVLDPFAGSYYMESLTDQMEEEILDVMGKIQAMGGAVAAIEAGYMQREIARSAYEYQRQIETGDRVVVGVNAYVGENELEVQTTRLVPHPYDVHKREEAERKQLANLAKLKKQRDNEAVEVDLKRLREAAHDESVNLIPVFIDCVKDYATLGEMCGVLREVFGEYRGYGAV